MTTWGKLARLLYPEIVLSSGFGRAVLLGYALYEIAAAGMGIGEGASLLLPW